MITQALTKLLYIDLESAPIVENFMELPDRLGDLWMKKHEEDPSQAFTDEAGLHAEFAKVVCVSVGYFFTEPDQKEQKFKVMSLVGEEKDILTRLATIMDKMKGHSICGHNVVSFDLPFLSKRYIINGLSLPDKINNGSKKPWDRSEVDTMSLWSFGVYGSKYTSLDLLTAALSIQSPKDGIDGSMVGKLFYNDEIEKISRYCQDDVLAVARVTQVLTGLTAISDENVVRA